MSCKLNTEFGQVDISNLVIQKIAGTAAMECYGVVGMAAVNIRSGISRLLRKESLTKGITVTADGDGVSLDIHVIVMYGTSIAVICESLIDTVKYRVEEATGLRVSAVNVFVDGLKHDE